MSTLRNLLKISILTLVVFSALSQVNDSYAYWASNITQASPDTVSNNTVTVGTWTAILPWDPATTYVIGDRVISAGSIYEAKKDNPTKEPGVDGGWNSQWLLIGPA